MKWEIKFWNFFNKKKRVSSQSISNVNKILFDLLPVLLNNPNISKNEFVSYFADTLFNNFVFHINYEDVFKHLTNHQKKIDLIKLIKQMIILSNSREKKYENRN